jgi:hypothetical protein
MAGKTWSEKLNNIIVYGFYLWIFLLPWQTRYFYEAHLVGGPWEAGSLSIYVSEIILLGLLFLRFILWSRETNKFNFNFKRKYFLFLTFLILFVVYTLVSTFWSVFPELTIYYSLKLLLGLGVFWLMQNKQITLIRIATVLVVAGAMQGLLATWQFLDQFIPASKWLGIALQDPKELGVSVIDTGLRRWLRGYGSFPHPNILGGFLTMTLIFALYLFDQSEFLWQKIKSKKIQVYQMSILGAIVMITSGIILSFSRAAWLASMLAILFIAVLSFAKNKFMSFKTFAITVVCMATVGIMWVSVYTEPFITRATGNGYLETMSVNQRLDSLTDAWQMFKKQPALGVGFGAYTYALHQTFPERTVWQLQPPHNTYLLIAVELGVIGLLFYIILILYALFITWKNKLLFILLINLLVLVLFDYWWFSLCFGLYIMMLIYGLSGTIDKRQI